MISSNLNELSEYIISNILLGKWKEHEKISSEQSYVIKFKMSRSTVKKTLLKLITSNIIYSKEKEGYFVQSNHLRTIFKRESKMEGCDSYAFAETTNPNYFKLEELKKTMGAFNENNELNKAKFPSKMFSFVKLYFSKDSPDKIKKVSISKLNSSLIPKNQFDWDKPLFLNLLRKETFPIKRIEHWEFSYLIPGTIRKILKIPNTEGTIIRYVSLYNDKMDLVHAAKIFVKINDFKFNQIVSL